jgi:hypothetical protein
MLMFGLPLALFALLFALEWRRTADTPLTRPLQLAAGGSLGAAVVHGLVMPEHLHESAVLGWFFALLCVAQVAWVLVLLVRLTRTWVTLGVLGNLATIVLWAWSRTLGIPFGIDGGLPERITAVDLLATGFEVAVVLGGLEQLFGGRRQQPQITGRPAKAEPAAEGVGFEPTMGLTP